MDVIRHKAALKWFAPSMLLFFGMLGYFAYQELELFYFLPLALLAAYICVFHSQLTIFIIVASTPLSINIEDYTDGFGLYLPTEPLCAGLMLILLAQSLHKNVFERYIWKSAIVWVVIIFISWMMICCLVSEHPIVSMKFVIAKLWFIIPLLLFSPIIFFDLKAVRLYHWLLISSMAMVAIYTTAHHLMYRFGEPESHWVMQPFFKDHTIYGATITMIFPLAVAFFFSRKHNPLVQFIFICFMVVLVLGIFFSYTRGAWLSIILALGVWFLIRFKVKFSLLLTLGFSVLLYVWVSWTSIQQNLAKNKKEHTTVEMGDRLQSATNVTTDASNLERLNRWNCALEMFYERPFFGFGPGTYALEYARFQEPEHKTIISTNFGYLGNAHSEFLGPLSEMGIFGLLGTIAMISAIFYQGIRLYHRLDSKENFEMKTLVMGMILGLSTYFIHGLINNYLDTDKASVPIWTMCAIFIAWTHKLDLKDKSKKQNEPLSQKLVSE